MATENKSAAVTGMIVHLHNWFCRRVGVELRLCFSERLWFDRLRDYDYDDAKLREDCDLIIRHLKREIARDKRNLGALKLNNFLQPDNFDADLAFARLANKKPHTKVTKDTKEKRLSGTEFEKATRAGAEQLRKFRQGFNQESRNV